ncbi:MAG TPA: TetR/AcrR family transcriptional regulator [Herpetosiphonaceae bacterium]
MTSKDRRERIKQATRLGILAAARRIARDEGWPAVTIRKVAEAVEYSPSIVYEYFESKDAILAALLEDGFAQLTEQMRQAAGDEEARLRQMGQIYWRFACEQPELYQVMHGLAGGLIDPAQRNQAAVPAAMLVAEALADWGHATGANLPEPMRAAEIVWSLLHGMASLALSGSLPSAVADGPALVDLASQTMLDGWRRR